MPTHKRTTNFINSVSKSIRGYLLICTCTMPVHSPIQLPIHCLHNWSVHPDAGFTFSFKSLHARPSRAVEVQTGGEQSYTDRDAEAGTSGSVRQCKIGSRGTFR